MTRTIPATGVRIARLATTVLLIILAGTAAAAGEIAPRRISDAERTAVEIAAGYLSRGPAAVTEHLSATSPLKRIPAKELGAEIETRLGPIAGAQWQLATTFPALADKVVVFDVEFPSGADDAVMFRMTREGSTYAIADITMLAMPVERPAALKRPVLASTVTTSGTEWRELAKHLPLVLGLLAALTAVSAALMARGGQSTRRHTTLAASTLAVSALVAGLLAGRLTTSPQATATNAKATEDGTRLARLLPVRRALASGIAGPYSTPGPIDDDPHVGVIARLWHAQLAQQSAEPEKVKRMLAPIPEPSEIPLAEILRARAALLRNDEVAAAVAYENAISLGPGRDTLWSEAAQSVMVLGFEDRARRYFDRLQKTGSRDADVYYVGAALASMKNRDDRAAALLEAAWKMRPVDRADLVEAAVFWETLRKAGSSHYINLSSPIEATFAAPDVSSRPITLPPDASARVSGSLLSIRVADRELLVPGGAALAPAGTPVVDAGTWKREDEAKGLADFEPVVTSAQHASAYTQPALKQRILRTATALHRHNRWADLVRLTDGLDPKSEHIPAEMFFARDTALQRVGRTADARNLVERLAVSRALQRKNDVDTLVELGELLAEHDLHDAAIRVFERAHSLKPNDATDRRIGQLVMNKRLATRYSTHRTQHFEIRYPEEVTTATAESIGKVLEFELKRLQKWVPVADLKPVTVNVVWWEEFRSTYTGSDYILGFFQKSITVPFAGIPSMFPEAVSILSHELCHAMIAQATNNQSPRWFHEGLASRIEMREYHDNAFTMYDDDKLLALSLIDAVIGGSPDPSMISQGYSQSQTLIRYIEAAHGQKGIQALINSFRGGATTEEALQALSGKTLPEFEHALRTWGRSGGRTFESPTLVRYDSDDAAAEIRWSPSTQRAIPLGRQQ